MENDIENLRSQFAHINGWGIDIDPRNEPTYPIKKYTGDDHKRLKYTRPVLQHAHEEILHSNERPSLTAVFGTSSPPSGISGMIRRAAFKHSEDSWWHWLPLILADRIQVWEGIGEDLMEGHIPDIIAERGWKSEWKYNRTAFATKIAIGIVLTIGAVAVIKAIRDNRDSE